MAAMNYRGDWKHCVEYDPGDVVRRAGSLYLALAQNAGMDPVDPLNGKYWCLVMAPVAGSALHNTLGGLQGGDGAKDEFYHLTKDQAEAALFARRPARGNPFLTKEDFPAFEKRVTEFRRVKKPEGTGQLYGAAFGRPAGFEEGKFVAVGDNSCIVSLDAETWEKREIPKGFWRGVTFGMGLYVAVGMDGHTAASADGDGWTPCIAPDGDWNSITYGNGIFVAVADGQAMTSLDGRTQWSAKTVPEGYGRCVVFENGTFVSIGPKGVLLSVDGRNWTPRPIPHGTWRAVAVGEGKLVALSGKCAVSGDEGETWEQVPTPAGGWDALTYGAGFFVAVGGAAACMVSPADTIRWELRDVPNFVLSGAAFGKDTFVAVGSTILTAHVVDTAAALNAAHAPSGENFFVTAADMERFKASLLQEIVALYGDKTRDHDGGFAGTVSHTGELNGGDATDNDRRDMDGGNA